MRKIFHFDSPADPYVADAAVLCCFDHRISTVVRKFLKKQTIERADMIVVAGGAKTLASPRNDFEQDFILEQVRMSIRLHQTKRVLVMSHSDCATYGGLAHFKGDQEAEATHHRSELLRAGELLVANFPHISVEPYFVKFDGIWEVKGADHPKSPSGTRQLAAS
jgi:carbonic anhydrase